MKTKYFYPLLLVLIATFSFSSCNDFLETTPTDFISPENYFNTETDGDYAIAGVYNSLYNLYRDAFKGSFSSNTDENVFIRMSGEELIQKTMNATSSPVETLWNKLYLGVYRADFFLENVDKLNVTDEKKNAFRAEARFVRGFLYYHLTMLYGDVPLRLHTLNSPMNTQIARSPRAEVFDTICSDMNYAVDHLYTYTKQKGAPIRVCKEAAIGILGRVYLSMAGVLQKPEYYSKARDLLLPLVQSKVIKLNPDYTQIWKNISADAFDHVTKEVMFDIECNADPNKFLYYGWASASSPAAPAGGTYNLDFWRVTITLWQYYQSDKNDVRYTWNICDYSYDNANVMVAKAAYTTNGSNAYLRNPGKFRRDWETVVPRDQSRNGSNFPVLRYADVLLMLGEAENEVNGPTDLAFACLDSVRSRSKAFKYSALPVRPTKDEYKQIMIQERARELCFESTTRYYDLLRWGILIDKFTEVGNTFKLLGGTTGASYANTLYFVVKPYQLLFPIPQSEIQLNKLMTQNPQY